MGGMTRKATIGVAGLAMILAFAASGARGQAGAGRTAPKMAEEVYKNIQVLQGVPADLLLPTMQLIAISLGTQCNHCHVNGGFERDDKAPKEFARVMMKMVFALNKGTFGDRPLITCYTCHRGNLRPVGTVEPADMGKTSPAPGLVGNQPSANQMIDQYLQAIGGSDAISKISTRVAKGKIESAANPTAPVEMYAKAPDKGLTVTHILGTDSFVGFNGNSGWISNPTNGTGDLAAAETEAAKLEDPLYLAANVKKTYRWHVEAPEKAGDREAYVLNGDSQGHVPVRIYLDRQTGLLLRLVHFVDTPFGRLPAQLDYGDYREVDGVKVPFQISAVRPNGRNTIRLEQVQQNVPVEDAKFVKPATPAP